MGLAAGPHGRVVTGRAPSSSGMKPLAARAEGEEGFDAVGGALPRNSSSSRVAAWTALKTAKPARRTPATLRIAARGSTRSRARPPMTPTPMTVTSAAAASDEDRPRAGGSGRPGWRSGSG